MVSRIEQKFKRSVNNLLHIWFLLCGAVVLAFFLYFNQLTTHTSLQYMARQYRLYDRQCNEITDFRRTYTNAPFYYRLWIYGQDAWDDLHQRAFYDCSIKK